MTTFTITKSSTRAFIAACLFFIIAGVVFRCWNITQDQFVFYDEGFYLNHNRLLGEMIQQHAPLATDDLFQAFRAYLRTCLASGKSLWFMVADARIFFNRVHEWYWARVGACVFGLLTIFLTYCFAARFFQSRWTAWMAAALLAVLPSHVFYSRIGLQEAFSTFLVLVGFYFYIFAQRFSWRVFVAGIFFGLAFFSNYRLIMLPFLIGVAEVWMSAAEKRWFDLRRYVWCVVMFLAMVFGIGGTLFGGVNTFIIFAWIFHQQQLAGPQFHWFNLLSYPYYLFRLEHWTFALMFIGSIWVLVKKHRWEFLPFVLVAAQMAVFSLPEEKGARYLCVVYPFMVMMTAYVIEMVFVHLKGRYRRGAWAAVVLAMAVCLAVKASQVVQVSSDYQPSAEFLLAKDPNVKFLSSQKYVQDLYMPDRDQVKEAPRLFPMLVQDLSEGYEYLVLGPQAYMSFPEGDKRFALQLGGPYEFILRKIEPLKVYDHFNPVMLERFVLEHSSNLLDSTEYLRLAKASGFGKLYIYDLKLCVPVMMGTLAHYRQQMGGPDG